VSSTRQASEPGLATAAVRGWHVEVVMELTAWLLSAEHSPRRLAPGFGPGIGTYWRVEFDEGDEPDVCVYHPCAGLPTPRSSVSASMNSSN
jgi:hypothetical protein